MARCVGAREHPPAGGRAEAQCPGLSSEKPASRLLILKARLPPGLSGPGLPH